MRHPERVRRKLAPEDESKDLLCRFSGQPIIQTVLNRPKVQRSRSFGFPPQHAKTRVLGAPASRTLCRNTVQFAWLALRMAYRGVRWIANRDVCKGGYSNSGNA